MKQFISWSLLEKLTDAEVVRKFLDCYGTRKYIVVFSRACNLIPY
jgi:hypothetical protein